MSFVPSAFLMLASAVASTGASTHYVGRETCAGCHPDMVSAWSGSHHDLAMQVASEETVLGDFKNNSLTHFGVTSSFFRRDHKFVVRTDGPDGKLHEYPVKYTFGVEPLQQYLVEFPGGRLQALSLAWDTRPEEQGGQRWFHLHPEERITHEDALHWTQPSQNWNSQCAECHSTNLRKNYDPVTKTYSTSWSEIDVSCEACHGPGANHVSWAERKPGWERFESQRGLQISLEVGGPVDWQVDAKTGQPVANRIRERDEEIELCARCHSRRQAITAEHMHGEPFWDHYRARLLEQGLYFADGQIQDEVYVYGSFIQSKMYQAGVTCGDCHDPHSLQVRAPRNGVCLKCHLAAKYDDSRHHFHDTDSAGSACVECHMPPRTYMVVDPRRDHSIRVPRPDLSAELGTPNACNRCHSDKSAEWAADHLQSWYPRRHRGYQQFAEALATARNGGADAERVLAALVRDRDTAEIARATALSALAPHLSRRSLAVIRLALAHESPMLRVAALGVLRPLPPGMRVRLALPLLEDPIRAVRIEAALALSDLRPEQLPAERGVLLEKATAEYVAAQQASAERPEAQVNLGILSAARGETAEARAAYETAIELGPWFIPAYVNLADLYRAERDELAAERVLRRALEAAPENATVHHALGLSLARQKHTAEAVNELRLAYLGAPGNARYSYVYGVALHSAGQPEQAVRVLHGAHERFPSNTDILNALVAFHQALGDQATARAYAERLRTVSP